MDEHDPLEPQAEQNVPPASDDELTRTLPSAGLKPGTPASSGTGRAASLWDPHLPPVERNRYVLLGEFARGGTGRILQARDTHLDRMVALKELLFPGRSGSAQERFRTEALITARLQHPSIVPIYEAGRWPSGEPFYSMRLVSGRSLDSLIAEAKTLAQRLALLPHVLAVAEAVAYAHSQRIIHRDLKPSNVLVGAFGETVVIDWGLAKDLSTERTSPSPEPEGFSAPAGEGLTVAGTVMGTPAYMPPEQAIGLPADERADVYSLGAILYHLLAGTRPYTDASSGKVIQAVLTGPPVPLAERQEGIPEDLLTLVGKAMARQPAERYPTARELAEDLRRFQTGQIVGAHRYTRRERIRRFVRQYQGMLAVAAAALLVLSATGGFSVWQILAARQRAERNEAEALKRADSLALMQARAEVEKDPNAVAWLRQLSPAFTRWPEVRLVAADARARGLATLLKGHEKPITSLRFTPDGRTLVTSSDDGTLRVWSDAHAPGRVLTGHSDEVWGFALSPDGRWLASASNDHTIRLWELATGQSRVLQGHDHAVAAVVFLPDGKRLVSAGQDGTLRLWDLATGRTTRVFRVEGCWYEQMAAAPDLRRVALTAFDDPLVRLWDLESGELRVLTGHGARTGHVASSPRGDLIATGSDDRTVRIWDAGTGVGHVLGEHRGPITALAFSPDGRTVAAASSEPGVRLWDVTTGQMREFEGHEGRVEVLAFSPDGASLASGGNDRSVRLWDLATGQARVFRGPQGTLLQLAFSPDGQRLAAGGMDGIVRVFDLTVEDHRVLPAPHGFHYSGLWLSSDWRRLALGGKDGSVRLWDLATGSALVLGGHEARTVVAMSADGHLLASGGEEGRIRLWSAEGKLVRMLKGHPNDILVLAFSPDGRQLASAGYDGEVRLWDVTTGQSRRLQEQDREHLIPLALLFSPDGSHLASAAEQGQTVRLWNLATGAAHRLGHEGLVRAIRFSPDGGTLATGGTDNALHLWDLEGTHLRRIHVGGTGVQHLLFSPDGQSLLTAGARDHAIRRWDVRMGRALEPLEGHGGKVNGMALSGDGQRLVSASDDETLRLWDLASRTSRVLRGHTGPVLEVRFSPDGRRILSFGADDTVRVWPEDLPLTPEALRAWLEAVDESPRKQGS
ncbi:WD40 repeat domain-containing serine/threonine-protein kinase [Cystobacter fuscus]|uniref:WD40 repeat domain-containing serine/threonine-protein kinase n=1 Tax=Cystobacter fuscus TaxID=43 RepID=UPI002B3239D6|nr:protein kinase [Cystobacter fuscus]